MKKTKKAHAEVKRFEKSELINAEVVDKASLWILRIILKLGGYRDIIHDDCINGDDSLVYFLELEKYKNMNYDRYSEKKVFAKLKSQLENLEKRKKLTSIETLTKNINKIAKLVDLNEYEKQILEFTILLKQFEILDSAISLLGSDLNVVQVKNALSVILNIPKDEINKAFATNSKLIKSELVTINKSFINSISSKLNSISDSFIENMMDSNDDISEMIKESVCKCSKSELVLRDYEHINKDIEILMPYLNNAIKNKQAGVNILFYGLPGTGKTELVKVLSDKLKCELFEVSYINNEDEPIDGFFRLRAYKSAQALLAYKKTILMYDEAEDIFESSNSVFGFSVRQKDKAWINRILETNIVPTIWITNNINSIDNALIRRFDMSIEIPIPAKSKREEIVKNYSKDILDASSIKDIANNENIAPALLSTTAKVITSVNLKDSKEAFKHLLNSTLKAQGYSEIRKEENQISSNLYNPDYINTTIDLRELAGGIKSYKNARICLYGIPGTGKSAFGKYIANTLDRPLLLKKASDLISKYVGGTEKNIANAFKQATEEDAVLVFDEVDSFLTDRSQTEQSWEVTKVNEMLVQMEKFDGVFIATTNLMENLDKASIRRFDIKLEFDCLKPKQAWKMFLCYCKDLKLTKPSDSYKSAVKNLKCLTPGDFAVITRQNRFRPIKNVAELIKRLEDEVSAKDVDTTNVVGFQLNNNHLE